MPGSLAWVPYGFYTQFATRRSEQSFLANLTEGDVAYLWPAASLRIYEEVARQGFPIVSEGINTRMAYAKQILDAAYEVEGLAPTHGITDERIRIEDEKLGMTTAIFAPSRGVERSLSDAPVAPENILPSSYGASFETALEQQPVFPTDPPTVLFVGYGCIRKGTHQLLRAWARSGVSGRLLLAGDLEPAVRRLCSNELNREDVVSLGFVRDVERLYKQADMLVLPSFEEGDPLVTYEAAAHGLAILASPMGAGRIGEQAGCVRMIDPADADNIAEALKDLSARPDEIRFLGDLSRTAVRDYEWTRVGARRADLLRDRLGL
jgi:glycosyltransferase involved in cell wall biosynthesis